MTYSKKVPVVVGSKIIDQAMGVITKGELTKATMTWRQAHFGTVMSGSLRLSHTSSSGIGVEKEEIHSSPGIDTVGVKEFCLDDVQAQVLHYMEGYYPPFGTVSIHTNVSVRGHYGG